MGKKATNVKIRVLTCLLFAASPVCHSMADDQINMMNREIEGFKKETLEEQEHNEMLTMQLHGSRMDCAAIKKRINQKLAQKEVLQAHYSNCIRVLKTTERTLTGLLKVSISHTERLAVLSADSRFHPVRLFPDDCRKPATTSPS